MNPTITLDQAQRAIQTGVVVIDVQRSRLDIETVSTVCDTAELLYKLLHEAEAGAVFKMATTFWPKNNDYSSSPLHDAPQAIYPVDLNFIAQTFVEAWGSNTGRGIYLPQ